MKKSQIILLIAILFSTCNIFAQQKDDFIKLEDIVVFGKSHGFTDSLKVLKEDYSLTGIKDINEFAYEPYLKTYTIRKQKELPKTKDQAVFHFMAGSKSLIRSHLVYNSPKSDLLKFSADYAQDSYQSDWQNTNLSLYWLPQINDHKAILSYYQNCYQLDEGMAKLSGGKIITPDWQIDTSASGTYDISGKFAYTSSHQEDDWNDTITQKDYDAELDLNWQKNNLKASATMDFLIDNPQMQSWFLRENWIIDQAGLWLGVDPEIISVSFKYSHNISLGKNFSLLVSNDPYLSRFDRKALLELNNYLDLSSEFLQQHVPVNNSICMQYERGFVAEMSLNSKYIVNQMNYVMMQQYYEPEYLDNWVNEVSARLSWQWHDISFDHQAGYTIYDNKINFAPAFTFDNKLNYAYQKLTAELELNYNTGRIDQDDKYLEDALLLNFGIKYRVFNNLLFTAKVENIANNEYQKYLLSPKISTAVLGGFELNF
ncbi:MAG: hypothetical protein P9X26_02765 [Candidatus Stygibacter frigidus]|nr:hypothetical protein [Candidatus Stygibacter frigidus]